MMNMVFLIDNFNLWVMSSDNKKILPIKITGNHCQYNNYELIIYHIAIYIKCTIYKRQEDEEEG